MIEANIFIALIMDAIHLVIKQVVIVVSLKINAGMNIGMNDVVFFIMVTINSWSKSII